MGTVFRKSVTRHLPEGAIVIVKNLQKWAQWTDGKGKPRTARIIENGRITTESRTYIAKYRDGQDVVREISTGCRDRGAALSVLTKLERQAELVRSGVITVAENAATLHAHAALESHIDGFLSHLVAKGTTVEHQKKTRRYLERMNAGCNFSRLSDLRREIFERWLDGQHFSARVRNGFRVAATSFGAWLLRTQRRHVNPFAGVPRSNEQVDARRPRRALTTDELTKLIRAAKERPLDSKLGNRGVSAKLSESTRQRLKLLGLERATAYKLMALTGLRCNEVKTLTEGALTLGGESPRITLEARYAKNRKLARVALRPDVAEDLKNYLDAKNAWVTTGKSGQLVPLHSAANARVFANMPSIKVFDLDLRAAGIPKRDQSGRTLDLHSLRHTFATFMGRSGASMQVAQAAMRHSDPKLTSTTYTHLELVDIGRALDALPVIPMDAQSLVAPNVAPASGDNCDFQSIGDIQASNTEHGESNASDHKLVNVCKAIRGMSSTDNGSVDGGPSRTRTYDQVIMSHLL